MLPIQTRIQRAKKTEELEQQIRELRQKRLDVLSEMIENHPELTYSEIWDMYDKLTAIGKEINEISLKLA